MTHRTWQDNAEEFGALTKQGVDVRLAALVACSVEQIARGKARSSLSKASATDFAKDAGTGRERITRHLVAWEKCAANGWCKPSADLTPDDVNSTEVPTQAQFAGVFDATASGGRPRDSKPEDAVTIIEKRGAAEVVATMTPEVREKMSAALDQADRDERDLAVIARGGRVPTLAEINDGVGTHPVDIATSVANDRQSLVKHMGLAHEAATRLGTIDTGTWDRIHPALMAIFDLSPSAVSK